MIQNVCDTIQQSSHLIILSHGMMWDNVEGVEGAGNAANANLSYKIVSTSPNKRFASGIYPLLQQVSDRGIEVINIAGDFGQKQTDFEAVSNDGIHFIGSGITSEKEYNQQFASYGKPDKILLLKHNPNTKKITWQFVEI